MPPELGAWVQLGRGWPLPDSDASGGARVNGSPARPGPPVTVAARPRSGSATSWALGEYKSGGPLKSFTTGGIAPMHRQRAPSPRWWSRAAGEGPRRGADYHGLSPPIRRRRRLYGSAPASSLSSTSATRGASPRPGPSDAATAGHARLPAILAWIAAPEESSEPMKSAPSSRRSRPQPRSGRAVHVSSWGARGARLGQISERGVDRVGSGAAGTPALGWYAALRMDQRDKRRARGPTSAARVDAPPQGAASIRVRGAQPRWAAGKAALRSLQSGRGRPRATKTAPREFGLDRGPLRPACHGWRIRRGRMDAAREAWSARTKIMKREAEAQSPPPHSPTSPPNPNPPCPPTKPPPIASPPHPTPP